MLENVQPGGRLEFGVLSWCLGATALLRGSYPSHRIKPYHLWYTGLPE
jgi:hypothetical protein